MSSGDGALCWQGGVKSPAGMKGRHRSGLCMNSDLFVVFMFTHPVLPLQGVLLLSDDIFSPAAAVVCTCHLNVRRNTVGFFFWLETADCPFLCPSSELKKNVTSL